MQICTHLDLVLYIFVVELLAAGGRELRGRSLLLRLVVVFYCQARCARVLIICQSGGRLC